MQVTAMKNINFWWSLKNLKIIGIDCFSDLYGGIILGFCPIFPYFRPILPFIRVLSCSNYIYFKLNVKWVRIKSYGISFIYNFSLNLAKIGHFYAFLPILRKTVNISETQKRSFWKRWPSLWEKSSFISLETLYNYAFGCYLWPT